MQLLEIQEPAILPKLWYPKQVVFSPDALKFSHSQKIYENIKSLGIKIVELKSNRLTDIKGKTDAETYRNAKSTLAVIKAPDGMFRLQPIPPSADYQFHIATGCPAHCQYCYLAGSLQGLPVVKAYGNLNEILENSKNYDKTDKIVSYEVSCYTDPLSLEHLTSSLSETIVHFSKRNAHLRWVSKYDNVEPLVALKHNGKTRARFSVNAQDVVKSFETGAAPLIQRIKAAATLAESAYPIGLVVAPIMPVENWNKAYSQLFDLLHKYLGSTYDLTFEFITHRFTETSKSILENWYPNSKLPMNMEERSKKLNKFGGLKYVYNQTTMKELKNFFYDKSKELFPNAKVLYWT